MENLWFQFQKSKSFKSRRQQKIRVPQQAAFHPGMFEDYLPYLLKSLRSKADRWAGLAKSGETIEMVESWGAA